MKAKRYLNPDEIKTIMEEPHTNNIRDRLMLKLMLCSGLRRSEVVGIRKCDILIRDGCIRVVNGKGGKDRLIPLMVDLLEELDAYSWRGGEKLVEQDLLFPLSPTRISMIVSRYATMSGLQDDNTPKDRRITAHTLRHTYAVHSLKAGRDLRTLQMNLGHSSLSTTAVYLQLITEDRVEVVRTKPLIYEVKE